MTTGKILRGISTFLGSEHTIKAKVKKDKSTIYGAKAVNAQMGMFGRPTFDYDILDKKPRKRAHQLEKQLDKKAGFDSFYTQPSKVTKDVHKVYYSGFDGKKGTKDDIHMVDYSKPKRKYKTVVRNGVRYVVLSETVKDKKKALKDKQFAFRHAKDRADIERIRRFRRAF